MTTFFILKKNAENNIVKKRLRATVKEFVGYLSTENYQTSDFIDPLVFHNNLPVYD